MKHGIKVKDIRDFEKYANKLNEVITRIREYHKGEGSPTIYVTPNEMNLVWDLPDDVPFGEGDKFCVSSVTFNFIECGDW